MVITYWSFDTALIKTYTLPYLFSIKKNLDEQSKIYLFTLRAGSAASNSAQKNEIEQLRKANIHVIEFSYNPFGILMLIKMAGILLYMLFFTWLKKISVIHCWCTPGGAIGYILSLFTGKPLVLDSFEPHATSMVEGRTWKKNSLAFKLLFALEKRQYKKASYVITAAQGMDEYAERTYGIKRSDCFVKPACVDLALFHPSKRKNSTLIKKLGLEDKIVCVYAGKFGGIYLENETFDFFKTVADHYGDAFRILILTSHSDGEMDRYCAEAGLDRTKITKLFVPHHAIPDYIGLGDFAICPVKPMPSKRYSAPIKNSEYWAMGLPVVITSGISEDSNIIEKNNTGYVLKQLNRGEYLNAAKKMEELMREEHLAEKIRSIAVEKKNFEIADKIYQIIYGS